MKRDGRQVPDALIDHFALRVKNLKDVAWSVKMSKTTDGVDVLEGSIALLYDDWVEFEETLREAMEAELREQVRELEAIVTAEREGTR